MSAPAVSSPQDLRRWQQAFLARFAAEQLIVVTPTVALRAQWADAADRVGLHLDPRWRNAEGAWHPQVDGVVVTYQQVASAADLFAHHLRRPTLVVLDEVHHAGDHATWRTALRAAFDGARRRLALSGTPFRSERPRNSVGPLRRGTSMLSGLVYGYGEAVHDDVSRPLAFRLLDATLRWRINEQQTIAAFADELAPQDDARRLRTAIDPSTPLLPQMLRDADTLLQKARAVISDAAGVVFCDDRAHARAMGSLLRTIAGEKPTVVLSDETGAHAHIERFARGATNGPRVAGRRQHGARGSRRAAPARSRIRDGQAHRPVLSPSRRSHRKTTSHDPSDTLATLFMPADPTLTELAERVEVELRQQVAEDIDATFEVEPPSGPGHRPDFQALDAQVQAGGIIIAGTH